MIEPHEYALSFPSYIANPEVRRRNMFAYIDARDLGHMVECCLRTDGLGYQIFNVSNDDHSVDMTTADLVDAYYAGVPVAHMGQTQTFYSSHKAKDLLGFSPQFSWRTELNG